VTILLQDWTTSAFPADSFDRAYAIESSEHMPDRQGFFDVAFRVLKPGGILVICAWLARTGAGPTETRHLLEPICREGRMTGLGDEEDYLRLARQAGFVSLSVEDVSRQVCKTWSVCARRLLRRVVTQPRYLGHLLDPRATNRVFALTILRLIVAFRTGAIRYDVMAFQKPA
jgi:tocopherol O-methyltransferase